MMSEIQLQNFGFFTVESSYHCLRICQINFTRYYPCHKQQTLKFIPNLLCRASLVFVACYIFFFNSFIPGRLHDVRFSFSRGPMRLQHRAVDIACDMMEENEFPFIEGKWDMQSEPLLPEIAVSNIRYRFFLRPIFLGIKSPANTF